MCLAEQLAGGGWEPTTSNTRRCVIRNLREAFMDSMIHFELAFFHLGDTISM